MRSGGQRGARSRWTTDEVLHADVAVVCAGPGTPALLPGIGLEVPLRAFLEQVVHLGRAGRPDSSDLLPCLFDGPGEHDPGVYAMPTPGVGYKIGIDDPLRELVPGDLDRTPDPARTAAVLELGRQTGCPVSGARSSTSRCAAGRTRPTAGS